MHHTSARRVYPDTKKSAGFTLVELTIALALGIIISGAAVKLYLESKISYAQDEEMARLQENARFALDYLKREISLSGFYGGIADTSSLFPGTVSTDCDGSGADWALDVSTSMELVNNAPNSGTLATQNGTVFDCISSGDVVDGTDIFSTKRTADAATLDNGNVVVAAALKTWYLKKYDYSSYSWSFLTSAIPSDEATANSTYDYWQYYSNIYYIRDHSVSSDDNIPTLCNVSLINDEMEHRCLIEGIEDIQLEIGIDNDGDGIVDQYKNAPTTADFAKAVSVHLYLLARSVNPVFGYTNNKRYRLGVKNIPAFNDSYIRKVFSTTIKLRNIKLG